MSDPTRPRARGWSQLGAGALLVLLAAAAAAPASAADTDERCIQCHTEEAGASVRQWRQSAHAAKGVGCVDCHGGEHDPIHRGEAPVLLEACGRCHQAALAQHRRSRHGQGLHTGWGCTRALTGRDPAECRFCHAEGSALPKTPVHCALFLKQSSAMGELGCNRCHQVERSCASCHSSHLTDLAIVRHPGACARCHMGPDHPQWEAWKTSMHGTLHESVGPEVGPTCQACHMPKGTHDVSGGLTMSPLGALYPEKVAGGARAEMVRRCESCHGGALAERELARVDAIRAEGAALIAEAAAVIMDVADRGALDPMPTDRPPHPLYGQRLTLDAQLLYEDTSHIERLFFTMRNFHFAQMVKGAYHQNPDYTHWYGNARLKMDLVDIRSEARRLLERAGAPPRGAETAAPAPSGDAAGRDVEAALRALKRRHERGGISAEEYEREKATLLRRFLDGNRR